MEKHVVIIFPHPDDESFGTAGTIMNFRKQGVPVTYLCGTLGEMGRNMGSPILANRETLPKIRKKELEDACELLDIDLRLLGYRDKTIEFEDTQEVAVHIKKILEEIKPSLVITHYPGYAVHPDHNSLGEAAIEAVRLMDSSVRPKVWASGFAKHTVEDLGMPDIVHDVNDIFDKKVKAIFAHKSQASGMINKMKEDPKMADEQLDRLRQEQFYTWNFNQ